MDRTERLLDLVATLLDATAPMPFPQIRELFPDYHLSSLEAGERKFERDKAELAELGLPLRFEPPSDGALGGYLIDRDSYYLPELKLRSDEWALLYTAGGAALSRGDFPGARDLGHALRKIAFTRGMEPVPQFSDALAFTGEADQRRLAVRETLEALWAAVQAKKRVSFTYRSSEGAKTTRALACYGLAFRRGQWIAVGHDSVRDALRTFRVDRMHGVKINAKKPRSPDFEVPREFRLDDHLHQQSWDLEVHPPQVVTLQLDPSLAPLRERLFPHAEVTGDGTCLKLTVRNHPALVRQVLALGPRVKVISPPEVRNLAIDLLRALHTSVAKPELNG